MNDDSSLRTLKSSAEATGNTAETAQSLCRKEYAQFYGGGSLFVFIVKNPTRVKIRRYVENILWKPQFGIK